MTKLHPLAAALSIAAALAVVIRRGGYSSSGVLDTAIFAIFLIFFWWLISDFSGRRSGPDTSATAGTEKSIAFRFGRFLSAIFRRG